MPLIKWNETFSVKNDKIDDQHKKWIEIINNLHDALMSETDPKKIRSLAGKTLQEMCDYAAGHFSFEEQHMEKIGFPGLKDHKEVHDQFNSKLNSYMEKIRSGKLVLSSEVMKELMGWLVNHILHEDNKYYVYASVNSR